MLILIFLSLFLQSEKLVKQKIQDAENTFTFSIPEDFIAMSEADRQQKLQSYRKSVAAYSSYDRQTDFGVNRAFSRFPGNDIELLSQFYKSSIYNLYTKVEMINEEIKEINGRKFAVFEFNSYVSDEEKTFGSAEVIAKYVYVQYTVVDDNTIVCNFQCPLYFKDKWQETASEMMNSISIK
ncbi:MAG: hypothetical protein AAF363_13075 [Bacteroidota bacterium]